MRRVAWTILLLFGGGGCAARGPADMKLLQRLEELAQREAQAQKQVEELNNRLFLLEDKVDTGRVAMESSGKPPQLPVVRLSPRVESEDERAPRAAAAPSVAVRSDAEDETEEDAEEPSSGGKSVVEQRGVAYGGAAKRGGPRPLLRLHESAGSSGPPMAHAGPLPGPDPMSVTERLPVVPIPRRADAKRAEDGTKKAEDGASKVDNSPVPMREYSEAMSKYKAGQHAAAAEAFRRFLHKYTKHVYADNAVYWMGECAYDTKNYRAALKMFRQVVEDYPTGNKAPDALLKMAYCYIRMKEEQNARTVLAQVVESFPKSQVARLASETLAKLQ
jgi:tol-pal system protein YbgF